MSFASDQLYDGYIRTHMSAIVNKVKVREILPHLPCLTLSDRVSLTVSMPGRHGNIQPVFCCRRAVCYSVRFR